MHFYKWWYVLCWEQPASKRTLLEFQNICLVVRGMWNGTEYVRVGSEVTRALWPFSTFYAALLLMHSATVHSEQSSILCWQRCHQSHLTHSILKKFPTFHGTWRFITAFTSASHLPLSWTRLIQSIMSLFHCLGHTRLSVQVRGFLCKRYVTGYVFTVRSRLHLAQSPSWRTTPCRLSTTAFSIYSWPPYILEAVPPSTTRGHTMPWWQGPTYHGTKVTWSQIMLSQLPKSSCI